MSARHDIAIKPAELLGILHIPIRGLEAAAKTKVFYTRKRMDKNGRMVEQRCEAGVEVDRTPCSVQVQFEVPLDHRTTRHHDFEHLNIVLTSTFVFGGLETGSIKTVEELQSQLKQRENITVFLCGGPGDYNPAERNPLFNVEYLKNDGCLIFLDYRGTGSSHEIRDRSKPARHVEEVQLQQRYINLLRPEPWVRKADKKPPRNETEVRAMANLLSLFRQDSIVYDLESIRQCLFGPGSTRKWNIFGQSYGGWVSLTYLSQYPRSLASSTITAGLAPITASPDEAYSKLFQVVKERNDAYYRQYPDDIHRVKRIVEYLLDYETNRNPGVGLEIQNGRLTARRFLCIGRGLGARDRFSRLHDLIERMYEDLEESGDLDRRTLDLYCSSEDSWGFDRRPLYAVLHEAMYCRGAASNWSAQRVARSMPEFSWAGVGREISELLLGSQCKQESDEYKIYFSGEMVYPFMFEDYDALVPLAGVAEALARHVWVDPYNDEALHHNQVPVYALSYESDMHVNTELAKATAGVIGKNADKDARVVPIRHKILTKIPGNGRDFQHASLRSDVEAVLRELKDLIKGSE
ncbi:hypothetical protein PFICI_01334 [Pestalotiopsis fici W106-1]|uniref:AB hydrolase-1 domain-containing protein n=1 Tax=Pestalotiopsis fici (strain W106-1 / CGMCC3.15140) TaxID=1229662 RepID=W3XQG2_PESFW|nr:uncharacterized protein PFICI_01334 [Pestalotiopsis fici W106-1]ETS87506.1 hypothetical protein PFICI_01334 [Pestalotiopsis fici W106-1]